MYSYIANRCPVEPRTAGREAVDTIDVLNGGIQNHILPDQSAVFQITLKNISPTQEASNYVLSYDLTTNQRGLEIFVNGQPLANSIMFSGVPYGSTTAIVEMYKGVDVTYDPVTFWWGSACDGNIATSVSLSVSYLNYCARAEFYDGMSSFAVDSSS